MYNMHVCLSSLPPKTCTLWHWHLNPWCSTHEKGPYAICGQRRPWSACANAQADQGLRCPLTKSMYVTVYVMEHRMSRLDCGGARSYGPSLFAFGIKAFFPRSASHVAIWAGVTIFHVRSAMTDQPAHPRSLVRVFTARLKTLWIIGYPHSDLRFKILWTFSWWNKKKYTVSELASGAQSDARPTGDNGVAGWIPCGFGNIISWRFIMKKNSTVIPGGVGGGSGGVVYLTSLGRPTDIGCQLRRPAIIVAGKGREGQEECFYFICFFTFIHFPLSSLSLSFISSISFLPFSWKRHKMTHKCWRVVKTQHNQSLSSAD